ncbi:MAG: hypothetical protein IJK63_08155 [Oscillospiraceae bacterium]|nr:hypothetical protein [Oscillospiraceae bacterium]
MEKLTSLSKEKSKIITLILLALGLVLVVTGLVLMFQSGTSHTGGSGGLSRASTSIQFGADFYTTSAQATGLAANAVIDLYKLVSMASGIFFLFVGGVEICLTLLLAGKQCEKAEERKEEDAPAAAAPETN